MDRMADYYSDKLSADRLKRVYEITSPRAQRYFEAEINHVLQKVNSDDLVLDLGCGYGRVIPSLAKRVKSVVGIDTSLASLLMGQELFPGISNYSEKFWDHRLEWFRLQSEAELLGEIDYDKTRNGMIVCKDEFTAKTVSLDQFLTLTSGLNVEVDESSVFCEMSPKR